MVGGCERFCFVVDVGCVVIILSSLLTQHRAIIQQDRRASWFFLV